MIEPPKHPILTGTPLGLAPQGTVWRWLYGRLEDIEDAVMVACRRGEMKRIEGHTWIMKNIAPLEDRFLEGDRSVQLIEAITDLAFPPEDDPSQDPA